MSDSETDSLAAVHIPGGTKAGHCENCGGLVIGDDVDMKFPVKADCGICGGELEKAKVFSEGEVVDPDVLASSH